MGTDPSPAVIEKTAGEASETDRGGVRVGDMREEGIAKSRKKRMCMCVFRFGLPVASDRLPST